MTTAYGIQLTDDQPAAKQADWHVEPGEHGGHRLVINGERGAEVNVSDFLMWPDGTTPETLGAAFAALFAAVHGTNS